MKKYLLPLLILTVIFSLSACETEKAPIEPDDDYYTTENVGFIGGNIGAGGLMAGDGNGQVFYRSEADNWKLYRAYLDGTAKTLLSDDIPSSINVLDDWVYYSNFEDNFSLYKIQTDGTQRQKLIEGYCSNLHVADSGMYFDLRDESNSAHVYHLELDGGDPELLVPDMSVATYFEGVVYCHSVHKLCAYDLQTDVLTEICEKYTHNVSVDESGIYYWAVDENTFCRIDHDSGEEQILLSEGDYFNYAKAKLYYKDYGDDSYDYSCIYCLDVISETTEVVLTLSDQYFNAKGELLGVTIAEVRDGIVELDESFFNEHDGMFDGFSEQAGYTYVVEKNAFNRGSLRKSILSTGKFDCWILYDKSGGIVWD